MDLLDTAAIFRFHQNLIEAHGENNYGALGWMSAESQKARYEVMASIGDLNNHSVMDLGCGHGDLRPYLGELYPRMRYLGVERIPALLNIAIDRYSKLPDTLFFEGDFSAADLPVTDYVFACGSLSYRNSDPLYVFRMIEKLFNNCRLAFGFNLLSNTSDPEGIITSYNQAYIMDYCSKLTKKVSLIQGYWKDDFTVFMHH